MMPAKKNVIWIDFLKYEIGVQDQQSLKLLPCR